MKPLCHEDSGAAYDFDQLCIGSGPAGQRAAIQTPKLGKRGVVVKRGRLCAGLCVEAGTIPSKTFREAMPSFLCAASHAEQHFGNHLDSRPTADQMLSRVEEATKHEVGVVIDQLRRNDVTVRQGETAFRDAYAVVLTAANIITAAHTLPARPQGVPVDGEAILTRDDIIRLKQLPRKIVIVGDGITGVEYASMLEALKMHVTLVDKRTRLPEFVDSEIVEELAHQLRNRNETFRLGEAVERLELTVDGHRRVVLTLESGQRIVTKSVLCSVGSIQSVERLNRAVTGLTADKRGRVTVGCEFRTDALHICAAGDSIGYPSRTSISASQGRYVASYAFEMPVEPPPDHLPVGIYAIPEMSMLGPPEHKLTEERTPNETGIARCREIVRGQILSDDSRPVKLLFHHDDHRLIGVHDIGTGATELIHIGQAVLGLGGGLDYFLRAVFNYPALAECDKVATPDAFNKLSMLTLLGRKEVPP